MLSSKRHKREVRGDATGEKKTLNRLHKLLEIANTPSVIAPDLIELPDAATTAGFNTTFSLLESFFVLRLRLRPFFVGIRGRRAHNRMGEDLGACLTIADLEGGVVTWMRKLGWA